MTPFPSRDRPAAGRFSGVRARLPKLTASRAATPPAGPAIEGIAPWARFKRLTEFGWPRNFPIVQFPNAPLIIAFVAGQIAAIAHDGAHADAAAVSYLAMAIWAYEELVYGVNWFRHLLGFAYVVSTALHLALALRR
jgi:hypothetical protein